MEDNEHRHCLRIGDAAPDFTARSTAGPVSLSDFRGKWVLLFSHPADFTPVCTSEFVALSQASDRFAAMDCALLALSVDSLYSHFAWVRAIYDRFGVEVRFPIIEDPTLVVGKAYGMVSPDAHDSSTVRTNFFIDPEGTIRALACYPLNVGRSVEEMLRTLAALRAADETGKLAPQGWKPGDALLDQPDANLDTLFSKDNPTDWFLARGNDS
ncbi:peroxiredoxin [Alteraurantiacibacter aestuarii]|uniref:Thioredoxin peroxidase n=1 Tax=Alteraurantiacibacter aestuarii TaxID=650004 RepID=A0A844ZG16_9SPHN|nr:peroxiredoxin [Alteraurantiacibacter aestuarii]MXO87461.1 peroxiredoxin [Alteraurantiacibacter aestuarii]